MAANPDESRRRQEEAVAAALLLLGGRRYDLPALIRAAKVRTRPFRRIEPTEALRGAMARPYLMVLRAWAAERPALLAAYELALRTGDTAAITRQADASARVVEGIVQAQRRQFATILAQLEQWHRKQWNARIAASTGLDVKVFTQPTDVRQESDAAAEWNGQLIGDVHAQTRSGIVAALFAAMALRKPRAAVSPELARVIAKGRKRGLRIGVDQVDRTSRAFDRARRAAAGLSRFEWNHTEQDHPRLEHKRRHKRVYNQSNAPNDRAGVLPFCKCWERPLFD